MASSARLTNFWLDDKPSPATYEVCTFQNNRKIQFHTGQIRRARQRAHTHAHIHKGIFTYVYVCRYACNMHVASDNCQKSCHWQLPSAVIFSRKLKSASNKTIMCACVCACVFERLWGTAVSGNRIELRKYRNVTTSVGTSSATCAISL